jgi:hypothetical protein
MKGYIFVILTGRHLILNSLIEFLLKDLDKFPQIIKQFRN